MIFNGDAFYVTKHQDLVMWDRCFFPFFFQAQLWHFQQSYYGNHDNESHDQANNVFLTLTFFPNLDQMLLIDKPNWSWSFNHKKE